MSEQSWEGSMAIQKKRKPVGDDDCIAIKREKKKLTV